ncbi:MAG: hypothetical protein ACYC8T_36375 [Myxococcaceae bacterium]
MKLTSLAALPLSLLLFSCESRGDEKVDPAGLYEVSTQGSSEKVKAGEKGKVVIEIRTKPGAHVSAEAPVKVELKGKNVSLDKEKLTGADSTAKPQPGKEGVNPHFEVPMTGGTAGKGTVDGEATFYVCTEVGTPVCLRQKKSISVPVEVN